MGFSWCNYAELSLEAVIDGRTMHRQEGCTHGENASGGEPNRDLARA